MRFESCKQPLTDIGFYCVSVSCYFGFLALFFKENIRHIAIKFCTGLCHPNYNSFYTDALCGINVLKFIYGYVVLVTIGFAGLWVVLRKRTALRNRVQSSYTFQLFCLIATISLVQLGHSLATSLREPAEDVTLAAKEKAFGLAVGRLPLRCNAALVSRLDKTILPQPRYHKNSLNYYLYPAVSLQYAVPGYEHSCTVYYYAPEELAARPAKQELMLSMFGGNYALVRTKE